MAHQLGILARSFPPSPLRSIAFATFAAGAPVGGAIGFAIGGILTQFTEYAFLIPMPLRHRLTALQENMAIYLLVLHRAERDLLYWRIYLHRR